MTDATQQNVTALLPATTQAALEKVNTAKSAWLEARRKQDEAAARAETIRQRRAETEKTADAQNDEWRTLFRENNGVLTPEMKSLRVDVALGRETLEEFDALLAAHKDENEFLPWETADRAREYIRAHNSLAELRARQIWQEFMKEHGQQLIRTLSLLKVTLGRDAGRITGVVNSVNDPATVLKNFISRNITTPALSRDALPEEDPAFKLAGTEPDYAACVDYRKASSPAARHKLLVRREMAQGENAPRHREVHDGA